MNLNKFTKAELIKKVKSLNSENQDSKINNQSFYIKLVEMIVLIKSILIKLTLISLLIKIFKKYSLIRRLWAIINTIIVSIFGISLIDNFSIIGFITNLFTEITDVIGKGVEYLSNTTFYNYLANLFGSNKVETSTNTDMKRPVIFTNKQTENLSKESNEDERVSEWLNRKINDHKKEDSPVLRDEPKQDYKMFSSDWFYYVRIGIYITLSVYLTYHYWDDITPYATSAWNWIKSRFNRDDGNNGPDNPNINERYNKLVDSLGLNRNKGKGREIINKDITDKLRQQQDILKGKGEGPSNLENPFDQYFKPENKVQSPILSSPSLENLNSTVEQTWSESRTSSPESVSSSATIKPLESVTDNVVKPHSFLDLTKIKGFNRINENNWKECITDGVLNKMQTIENIWSSKAELTKEEAIEMTDSLIDIVASYNKFSRNYINNRDELSQRKIDNLKQLSFEMRSWISKYYSKISPSEVFNIGTTEDSPRLKSEELIEDILKDI
jgi:hypothetical protein